MYKIMLKGKISRSVGIFSEKACINLFSSRVLKVEFFRRYGI